MGVDDTNDGARSPNGRATHPLRVVGEVLLALVGCPLGRPAAPRARWRKNAIMYVLAGVEGASPLAKMATQAQIFHI